MNKLVQTIVGVGACTALLWGILYALNGSSFATYHNNRVLEHTRLNNVQGVFFTEHTQSIVQPIDLRLLHIGHPQASQSPVCLRLIFGSKFLRDIDQKIQVAVATDDQRWVSGPVLTQHKTRLFCFSGLRVEELAQLTNPFIDIQVLDPSDHKLLAALHAGPGQGLMPARVNQSEIETSLYYIIEAQIRPSFWYVFRYVIIVVISGGISYLLISGIFGARNRPTTQ